MSPVTARGAPARTTTAVPSFHVCPHRDVIFHSMTSQVLVSYSKGGLAELLQGSVASYLTHHCSRPVAVLHLGGGQTAVPAVGGDDGGRNREGGHAEETTAAAAATAGGDGGGRNLLVPVDGSDESLASLRWTLDHLYKQGGAPPGVVGRGQLAATNKAAALLASSMTNSPCEGGYAHSYIVPIGTLCIAFQQDALTRVPTSRDHMDPPLTHSGDTLHLVHIIPCLPAGDLATFFQPIDSDTGFLMEYPDPSLLGTKVPEEVVEREAQACKAEKVRSGHSTRDYHMRDL